MIVTTSTIIKRFHTGSNKDSVLLSLTLDEPMEISGQLILSDERLLRAFRLYFSRQGRVAPFVRPDQIYILDKHLGHFSTYSW